MQIDDFDKGRREADALRKERPWRKDAQPIGKPPSNPNYPKMPFNFDDWMKSSKKMEEDSSEIPEIGDTIRTKKMQMEGKVEKISQNRAGYDEVLFRIEDGRLMKTPVSNVIVIQKLADCGNSMFEDRIDELSTELLAKYKKAAGEDYSKANKKAWDPETSPEDSDSSMRQANKRFSGIVKATNKQFDNDKKKHVKESPDDNFTPEDIKRLEAITDLPALKAQAKNLITGKAARRMKPEKIAFFHDRIDNMIGRNGIIKLMYDLILSGEGHGVVGSRNSMSPNSYRKRFGEGSMGGINRVPQPGLSYERMLDEASPEEIAKKLSIRVTDIPALVNLVNGKIKFNDLPQPVRFALYNMFSGLPYDNDQNTNPELIKALNRIMAEQAEFDESYEQIPYDWENPPNYPIAEPPAKLPPVDPKNFIDPFKGKPDKLAKAPKTSMQGSKAATFSELVQDTIKTHGVKWAFDFYVKKHGLPPRQFKIFAGL